tara:strand:- start:476 stop:1153 length:678 start_codon:yes stop_codon:yes gene_type:complete
MEWLTQAQKLVDTARSRPELELEMRLGAVKRNKRFEAGVDAEKWDTIVEALTEYDDWKNVTPWRMRYDLMFANSVRVSVESALGDITTTTTTTRKTRVKVVDIPIEQSQWSLRLATSVEQPVQLEGHEVASASLVRAKQMRSFETQSGVRFDVSRVWNASTLSKVNTLIETSAPTAFEVELEIVNRNYFEHTNVYIVKSMLMKMCDLVLSDIPNDNSAKAAIKTD